MARASRRGYGEDGIYFDHRGDCRDTTHRTCAGRWRGVVSLGFDADGKPIRRKVSGQTRTEVRDKLKELHSELDAGVHTAAGYTAVPVEEIARLAEHASSQTTEVVYRRELRPVIATPGRGHGPNLPNQTNYCKRCRCGRMTRREPIVGLTSESACSLKYEDNVAVQEVVQAGGGLPSCPESPIWRIHNGVATARVLPKADTRC